MLGLSVLHILFKLIQIRPQLVFCTGGFVGVPVGIAAFMLGIPVFIHESNAVPGLSNRILARVARKIFLGFENVFFLTFT